MLQIRKNSEPTSLKDYRNSSDLNKSYKNMPHKDTLQEYLLKEQGYLCAYCMSRISQGAYKMRIEHFFCQNNHLDKELCYENMLACCCGNERIPEQNHDGETHCDVCKQNKSLSKNPANFLDDIQSIITYSRDGKISSTDIQFNYEINENVLNLNYARLKNNRRKAYANVILYFTKFTTNTPKRQIQKILDQWISKDSKGKFPEYAGVAIYLLRKRLNRAPN